MYGCKFLSTTLFLLTLATRLPGQVVVEERPQPFIAKKPATQKERDHRASLHQYTLGLLCQREDRLLEALKAFEAAARLDPTAPAVHKAQVPLLIALDRGRDAIAACQATLMLHPEDFETWFLTSRLQKSLGQFAEAQKSLQRGLKTQALKDRPEVAQGMWLELGTMHELADEFDAAIRALTSAAAILDHPDVLVEHGVADRDVVVARAAETYERIGNLYRKTKKYPEAIAAYQKAQQRTPDASGRLNYNLALLCQEEGKLTDALGYVDAYLRRQPLGTEAYEMKVSLLAKLKRDGEIVPWLEKASAADKFNLSLKTLLARQYAEAQQLAQAERLFLALAEETPSEEVYRGLFRAYQRDAAGSLRTLELLNRTIAVAAQRPITPAALHAGTRAKAMIITLREDGALAKDLVRAAARQTEVKEELQFDTLQLLAALADRQNLPTEAERFYRQALPAATPASEPVLYGGLLRSLWKNRKYDEILKVCQAGLVQAKATNHVLFQADLAKAHARLGQHQEALAAADRAVTLASDNDRLTLRLLRVRVLTQAQRHAQAEKESLAMLKDYSSPGDTMEIRYLLSNVYNSWKKLPQCEEQLELVLKADPNNATANNDLGYIWADHGKNLDQAEAMIRKALEIDRLQRKRLAGTNLTDNAAYVDSLGWVLFRRGKIDEARRELERAAALPDGDDPVIFDHLGDVYQLQQRTAEARAAWEKSVRLYEQERRRDLDERYQEVRRKLQSVTAGTK